MKNSEDIPVLLLTGYLGSGKTTLLNRILNNRQGIRFAVIVNDIGEVNIDADLIQRGGVVSQTDDSLVALQNGCICCTLKMDLVDQLTDLCRQECFDYIVIEASGICEPVPIAQTITNVNRLVPISYTGPLPQLDCLVTVVDALRMQSEFACGDALTKHNLQEDDIENLVIQQIEFCNLVLLNKAAEVSAAELGRVKEIIHALNPGVKILECNYGDIDINQLLHTELFDFDRVATSAAWIRAVEGNLETPEHEHHYHEEHEHHHEEHEHHHHDHPADCTCGCHHHHHHHDGGEVEEYGIGTYVYFRRRGLDLNKFDYMLSRQWPKNIIRAKGICYFADEPDKCLLFEQAGVQKGVKDVGQWFATMPANELEDLMARDANLRRDWDPEYGDRMLRIVFIGQHLDRKEIDQLMDSCLA